MLRHSFPSSASISATSLVKYFKSEQRVVSAETVLNYIKYCAETYLFYQVKRQDLQGKQILSTNEKYYIANHGIRDNFPKYVVSMDEIDRSRDGIKHCNIRDFLLMGTWY